VGHAEWVEVLGLGLVELVVVLVELVAQVSAQEMVQVVLALVQVWPDNC